MTKMTTLAALSATCATLAACGGGGDSPAPPPAPSPAAPTVFSYLPPAIGETDVWTLTQTDTLGSSATMQLRQRVTDGNDSGARVFTYDDPTGTRVVQDGLTFWAEPQTANVSASGNTTDYTWTSTTGVQTTCVYGSAGSSTGASLAAADRAVALSGIRLQSLKPGDILNGSYTITCGTNAPITYSTMVSVLPLETITVPAGSFQVFREVIATTWVYNGFSNSMGVTLWRDPARSMFPVKLDETIVHGDTSKPYISHLTRELQSRS